MLSAHWFTQDWLTQCQNNVTEQVKMLTASIPSRAALLSRYECALSQVGTRPDMTLDAAKI